MHDNPMCPLWGDISIGPDSGPGQMPCFPRIVFRLRQDAQCSATSGKKSTAVTTATTDSTQPHPALVTALHIRYQFPMRLGLEEQLFEHDEHFYCLAIDQRAT